MTNTNDRKTIVKLEHFTEKWKRCLEKWKNDTKNHIYKHINIYIYNIQILFPIPELLIFQFLLLFTRITANVAFPIIIQLLSSSSSTVQEIPKILAQLAGMTSRQNGQGIWGGP